MRSSDTRPPRIALVGNMNNNAFSQMRYFRDLGVDAVVFPFSTDAEGQAAHFSPQCDTYRWDTWRKYVCPLPIPNSNKAVSRALPWLRNSPSLKSFADALAGFDFVLGTGIAPALFERMGRRLDGFGPYSVGIEFYGTPNFLKVARQKSVRGMVHRRVRAMQARGVQRAGVCFNADMGLTRESFDELGVAFERLPTPMVYSGELYGSGELSPQAGEAARRMRTADLALFSASRHIWIRPPSMSERGWRCTNKNSDWPFRALARFVAEHPAARPLLVSVDYGPDAGATKKLVADLGLEQFVFWLPVLPRREIMALLSHADIGVGEFLVDDGLLWGGTGFEVLAAGRPLLQTLNFTQEGFVSQFGYSPPPIFAAKGADEIVAHLRRIYADKAYAAKLGVNSAEWFDRHAGRGLAQSWLNALMNSRSPGSQ